MWSWANKCESEAEERGLSRSSGLCCDALVIKVCGCQSEEERRTNRDAAAASSWRKTWLQGMRRSSPLLPFLPGSSDWTEGRTRAQAAASATKMIECIIDPPREILGWIIERVTPHPWVAAKTLFVAELNFMHLLAALLWIFILATVRRFLNISVSTSPPPFPS